MKINPYFLIGSYTHGNKTRAGEGITLAEFDPETGELTPQAVFRDIVNPSYLVADEDWLYAVSEQFETSGEVVCLRKNGGKNGGELEVQWRACSEGLATCHLSVDRKRGVVHAVSYTEGRLISLDAGTREFLAFHSYEGHGPYEPRQERAHAHQAALTPDGTFLLVPDLGSDKVWRHRLDEKGVPQPGPDFILLPPGCGPRHLVFHPERPYAYVLGELDGRIHCVDWLELKACGDAASIAPEGAEYPHGAGAIRWHPSGSWLYASHRAGGTLARVHVDKEGRLGDVDCFDAGGLEPRDFVFTSDGGWLLVACQHSDHVAVHRVDREGGLSPAGTTAIPAACCIVFFV